MSATAAFSAQETLLSRQYPKPELRRQQAPSLRKSGLLSPFPHDLPLVDFGEVVIKERQFDAGLGQFPRLRFQPVVCDDGHGTPTNSRSGIGATSLRNSSLRVLETGRKSSISWP